MAQDAVLQVDVLKTPDNSYSVRVEDILSTYSSIGALMYQANGGVSRSLSDKLAPSLSVLDYCTGDGVTDDTVAFQAAVDEAVAQGVALDFPGCEIRLTAPITVYSGTCIRGHNRETSIIVLEHTGSMFVQSSFCQSLEFRDFRVKKTEASSADNTYLFDFPGGVQHVLLEWLMLGNVDTAGIKLNGVLNTGASTSNNGSIVIREVWVNQFKGRGYNFGKGDSIWFYGGRIIGTHDIASDWLTNTAEAIVLNGGLGGFWLYSTDIVLCNYGLEITQNNGTTNREIFLVAPCFDSSRTIGLFLDDTGSYTSVSNLWAASCEVACVYTAPTYTGTLTVSGGTAFNAGGYSANTDTANPPCGFVLNGGLCINLADVIIRNNGNSVSTGKGIWCPSATAITTLRLTGVVEYGNQAASILAASTCVDVHNCNFAIAPSFSNLTGNSSGHYVRNNVGYPASISNPGVPASGVTITYNSSASPALVYLVSGSVTGVYRNGIQIGTTTPFTFKVRPGDSISLTYSSAPTWVFQEA